MTVEADTAAVDPALTAPSPGELAREPVSDAELPRALTAMLFGVLQHIKQHTARRASEYDMTVAQVRALSALREPLSMRELAERLYLDPSNLTALVDGLEDLGLVERTADADDRRVKRPRITARGAQLADEVVDAVFARSPVFEALDVDDQRLLLELLGRVVETPEA